MIRVIIRIKFSRRELTELKRLFQGLVKALFLTRVLLITLAFTTVSMRSFWYHYC